MSVGYVNGQLDLDVIDINDDDDGTSEDKVYDFSDDPETPRHSSASSGSKKRPQLMLSSNERTKEVLLNGIFGFEDQSYDVALYNCSITLTIIGGKLKCKYF